MNFGKTLLNIVNKFIKFGQTPLTELLNTQENKEKKEIKESIYKQIFLNKKKYFKFWLFIICLFVFGIRIALLGVSFGKESFQVIVQDISIKDENSNFFNDLLKGDKIIISFTAKQDNLGIIAIWFNTKDRINKDFVNFRIKESNQNQWYYQHEYATDQISPNEAFTFGFPKITDSKNKEYVFEIESLYGKKGSAISLNKSKIIILSKYEFQKKELFKNPKKLYNFIYDKVTFSLDSNVYKEFVYFSPLIIYIILFSLKKIKIVRKLSLLLIILLIIFNILLNNNSDSILFILFFLWVIYNYIFLQNKNYSLCAGIYFLTFCPILLIFKLDNLAAKTSVWAFIFILSELILSIIPKNNNDKYFI